MGFLVNFGMLALALIFQATLTQFSWFENFHPDLVLLTLIAIAFRHGSIMGVFCGFSIGLIQDVYAVESLGVAAFAKSLLGYLLGLMDERRFSLTPISKSLFLCLGMAGHDILISILIGFNGLNIITSLYTQTLPVLVFTLVLAFPLFHFTQKDFSSG